MILRTMANLRLVKKLARKETSREKKEPGEIIVFQFGTNFFPSIFRQRGAFPVRIFRNLWTSSFAFRILVFVEIFLLFYVVRGEGCSWTGVRKKEDNRFIIERQQRWMLTRRTKTTREIERVEKW